MEMDPGNIAYGAIAAFLINKIWDTFSGTQKEVVTATQTLTISIVELKGEIKSLNEKIGEIPGMRKDINSIGSKVRDLQALTQKRQENT